NSVGQVLGQVLQHRAEHLSIVFQNFKPEYNPQSKARVNSASVEPEYNHQSMTKVNSDLVELKYNL
ncbi:hypothetical protein A2U01_0112760, partial [Trifolium medium]|nr:hypothetical protein [Trifolium medium]